MAGYGDELMAAGQAYQLHLKTGKPVVICEANGKPRWHELWEHLGYILNPKLQEIEGAEHLINGGGARPYCKRARLEDGGYIWTGWRAQDNPPQVALTEEEQEIGDSLRREIGPYVVIDPSETGFCNVNRYWGFDRFQAVVDLAPEITWVQSRHSKWKRMKGTIDRPTDTFRAAIGLLAAAETAVLPDSGLHHASAAVHVPSVIIFGGMMERDYLGYPQNKNFGSDNPCGHFSPCEHCQETLAATTPEMVVAAVREKLKARANG